MAANVGSTADAVKPGETGDPGQQNKKRKTKTSTPEEDDSDSDDDSKGGAKKVATGDDESDDDDDDDSSSYYSEDRDSDDVSVESVESPRYTAHQLVSMFEDFYRFLATLHYDPALLRIPGSKLLTAKETSLLWMIQETKGGCT